MTPESKVVVCLNCQNSENAIPPWDMGTLTLQSHAEKLKALHLNQYHEHDVRILDKESWEKLKISLEG